MDHDQSGAGQCQWVAVSSFLQPLQPAETETGPQRPRGTACHPQARGRLAGRDRWSSLAMRSSRNQARVTPNTRNDPTQNSLADSPVASLTKSLKTFCCHLSTWESLSINHHHQPPLVIVAALRLGNHSTQSISSGRLFPPFHSIFNRNGFCTAIHRLGQGRCRRPEGCRRRPSPAQRCPALLQIRPRRCRLLLDNTRCPHPRRCVRRFLLNPCPIPFNPPNLAFVSASRPMRLSFPPLPVVEGHQLGYRQLFGPPR